MIKIALNMKPMTGCWRSIISTEKISTRVPNKHVHVCKLFTRLSCNKAIDAKKINLRLCLMSGDFTDWLKHHRGVNSS